MAGVTVPDVAVPSGVMPPGRLLNPLSWPALLRGKPLPCTFLERPGGGSCTYLYLQRRGGMGLGWVWGGGGGGYHGVGVGTQTTGSRTTTEWVL